LNGKVYEPETISFIRDKCYGKDIVHAGTYFGDFLPPLAEVAGNVWAFEPNPENYQCARITCELNRLANVELVHAALGSSRGSIWLKTEDEEGRSLGGASKVISDVEKVSSSTVDRLPIDEVIPGNCELAVLQLDVEGYEAEALAGALESIRCHRPILVLESIPEEPWFSEHLGPLGYHQTGSVGPNTVLTCDSD
jgi:FkbM family methyltransferase